jgi:tetratricopeptide (TPR) repeat protein
MGNANITYKHTLFDVNDLLLAIERSTDLINSQRSSQSLQLERETENLEDVTLIWLDRSIGSNWHDNQKTFQGFREINNFTKFSTDPHRCIEYIKTIDEEKVFVIISGSLTKERDVLSQIQSLNAVDSIFIFCRDGPTYEHLRKSSKIVDIFTEQEPLMEAIKKQLRAVSKQLIEFSFFDKNQKTHRNITKDSASFLSFQLLFDLLKDMEPDPNAKKELFKLCEDCYRGKESEKKKIEDFRDRYKRELAITWYTEESFLYKLLNKALRTEDIDGLYLFHFYIVDLWTQLKTESSNNKELEEKCRRMNNGEFILFRGQKMSEEELEKFKHSKGLLISPNGFFSTSIKQRCALDFIYQSKSHEPCPILFRIKVDSKAESAVFAYIEHLSAIKKEDEVLFSIGAVFKVNDVILNYDNDKNLPIWVIDMTLTDEGMKDVQDYSDSVKNDFENTDKRVIFGHLLIEMNELTKAGKYFNFLLKSVEKSSFVEADVLDEIGHISLHQLEKDSALNYYQQAYDIRSKLLDDKTDPIIGCSLNNFGNVALLAGDYKKARSHFHHVLDLLENRYQKKHPWIANALVNLTQCYMQKEDGLETALNHLKDALEIRQNILPKQYLEIGYIYHLIGSVYYRMKRYDDALKYYLDAFEQYDKLLLVGHWKFPDLIGNIVNVYKAQNDFHSAFKCCKEKLNELREKLGSTHPSVGRMYVITADIHCTCDEDEDALRYLQKALMIFEECIPAEKKQLLICYNRFGIVYTRRRMFKEGLEHFQRALQISKKIFSRNHPELARSLFHVGAAYLSLENYDQARTHLMKALVIFQSKFFDDHEEVKNTIQLINSANSKQRQNLNLFSVCQHGPMSLGLMLDLEMELAFASMFRY